MKSEQEIKYKIYVIQNQIDEFTKLKQATLSLSLEQEAEINMDIEIFKNEIKMLEWVLSPSTPQKEIQNKEAHNSYQEFFDFLFKEHNLVCTIQEMQKIKSEVLKLEEKLLQSNDVVNDKQFTMQDFMFFYTNSKYVFTADPQDVLRDMLNQKKINHENH